MRGTAPASASAGTGGSSTACSISSKSPEAQRARERALALAGSVPLIPLYAQGLALRSAPGVAGLAWDAQGLALLPGVSLVQAPGAGAP